MKTVAFGLLRSLRALLGAFAAAGFVSLCMTIIQATALRSEWPSALLTAAMFAGPLLGFVAMKSLINNLHVRWYGSSHPKMTRFAAL